eukprot:EG_transcript_26637
MGYFACRSVPAPPAKGNWALLSTAETPEQIFIEARWNGVLLARARSSDVVRLEGNVYFPPEALIAVNFRPSFHKTVCSWKGVAGYFDVLAGGKVNYNAAWYYAEPKDAAKKIQGLLAFWKGVQVQEVAD